MVAVTTAYFKISEKKSAFSAAISVICVGGSYGQTLDFDVVEPFRSKIEDTLLLYYLNELNTKSTYVDYKCDFD